MTPVKMKSQIITVSRLCNTLRILMAVNMTIFSYGSYLFVTLAQNIDYGLIEAVLMSTYNLCFKTKIRKIMYTYMYIHPSVTI